jgi:peptidoglycan/xylan/chitin deacetylase (PgdA/CDA1 family)
VVRIRGIGRATKLVQSVRKRFAAHALILAYHRIAYTEADPWGLCVSPQHFAEHLDILARRGPLLSMRELARRLRDGTLPHGAVAITFDDGYADNLFQAKPLLERHDAAATVFVPSGHVGNAEEFWWDRLQCLLLEPGMLPRRLCIERSGARVEHDLGDDARYDEQSYYRDRTWRVSDPTPTARHALYQSVARILRRLRGAAQREVLDDLARWAGVSDGHRAEYRTLSEAELRALANGGLVEIGAHTVSHPALSELPEPVQEREIADSRARLEELLEEPVRSFAYPYADRSPATPAIVSRAGFESAVTTDPGTASIVSPRFALPRALVDNVNGDRFSAWLDGQFAAA